MNKDIFFYDTSALLAAGERLFELEEKIIISSITFKELEHIKTSNSKDAEIKYKAREVLRFFEQYPDSFEVVIHQINYELPLIDKYIEITDDTRILMDAYYYNNCIRIDEVVFITNDLNLKYIASLFFGSDMIDSIVEEVDNYKGYKEIFADDESLAAFYQDQTYNHYNLKIGEYLILRDNNNEIIDIRVWTGNDYRYLSYNNFNSNWFGKISPYKGDIYQKLLFDSLSNNQITLVRGPAGSGKTLTSLAFLISKLEKGEIDKIIVFCNTVATIGSAKLGFYPGDRNSKLLDSQIGNLLSSKLGGMDAVERLIAKEQLVLLPMSDIRGYDTSGMRAGIYISEAQNLDKTLMKLALQRIGEDCICIIDGDVEQQVDLNIYAGSNNGMRRVSKIFRGEDFYGEVRLNNIYRSRIANIAQQI